MSVNISLVQLAVSDAEPVYERIPRAMEKVREAAVDAQMVVLPELWPTGAFSFLDAATHAQEIDGPLVSDLGVLAKECGVWLHGGSFVERDGLDLFNTSVLFAPDGRLVASYRKIHLFGFDGGETSILTGGEELVVVDTPLGPTGLATCYDLRFPEFFRALVEGDATAVLLSSGWPTPRVGHWEVLLQARAIEDQLLMIACNEVGQQGDVTLAGTSMVVDARGSVLARAGTQEEILRVSVEPGSVNEWRQAFPVLSDIRMR
jgi:predicted amidohydrolase